MEFFSHGKFVPTAQSLQVAEITNTETQDMENENVEAEIVNPEDQTTVDYVHCLPEYGRG